MLSLLFAIDDAVDLNLTESEDGIVFNFKNPTLQDFIKKWCAFKQAYTQGLEEIAAIEDNQKRDMELKSLIATQEEWKLRAMGTTIGCHTIVKKGTEERTVKVTDLT